MIKDIRKLDSLLTNSNLRGLIHLTIPSTMRELNSWLLKHDLAVKISQILRRSAELMLVRKRIMYQ